MLTRNINIMLGFFIILLLAGASLSQEYLVPGGEGFVRMEIGATHSFNGATWKLVGVNSSQNYIVIQKNSDTVVKVYREDYTLFSGSNIVYCEYFDTAGAYVSFGYSSPNYVIYANTTVAGNAGTRISFVGTRNSSTFEDSDPSFYNGEIANGWYDHMVRSNSNHTYTAEFNIPAATAAGNYDVWMALDFTDGARFMRKLTITVTEPVTVPEPTSPADGSNVSGTSINFSWSSVSGATSYYLQISPNSSFSSLFFDGSVGNVTSINASGFPNNGTPYYWHVRAYTSAGWGSYGSTWDFTNGTISAPTLASPAAGATNVSINPTLSWGSVSGAVSYALQVSTNSGFSSFVVNQSGISGTSYSINLSYSTTYYWRVNATNSSGTSSWSSRSFTTMAEPVTVPEPTSPADGSNVSGTSINFSWSSVSGATSYYLQISPNSSFSSLFFDGSVGNVTSINASGFPNNGTPYYWHVRAYTSAGWGSYGSTWDFTNGTISAPTLASPAAGATNVSINPTLSWGSVSGAVSYALQVSTNSGFSSFIVNQSGISGTSYSINLSYSTTYYWRVNATNSSGTSSWSSRSFTTMAEPLQIPDPPVLSSPANGASGINITSMVSWNTSPLAATYALQISTNSSFSNLVVNQSSISSTSYSVSLSYSTTYYWRVNATNSSGTSSWSSRSFTTMAEPLQIPDPPVLSSPANGASGINITSMVSWNASPRAATYALQISTNLSFSNLVVNQSGISGASYSINLSYNTTYYWRVNATNSAGVSTWSTPFSFSTVNAEVSPWYRPNTGISHSVIIPLDANPTIDGLSLGNGDIIGVFYDSSGTAACAGFDVWTGQGNIAISAAGNDATTPVKDGFSEGEKFQWKIWRKSDSRTFDANAQYLSVGALGGMVYSLDTFTANGLSALSGLMGNSMSIQQIPYRSGWNLLSAYVEPRSANLDSIFAPCRIDLVLLKNGMQKSYIPSQSINQIGNWIPTQGYQAKFNKAGTFTIKGRMLKPEDTPISLASGWSILPYLRSGEMPVASAFASIKDVIIIVKDQDGKTYLPSVNINQINTLKPGQAYQIKLSQARTFSYPANSATATRAEKVLSQPENGTAGIMANFICPWRNTITGSSHTIIIPLSVYQTVASTVKLEPGDAVGVFYDSTGVQTCAGYEYWDGINNIAVAAAADDPTTPAKDGFLAGDSLRWKIWKQSTGEVLNIKPIYDPLGSLNGLVTSSAIFEINGLSAMQSFGLTNVTNKISSLPETCTLMQNYPNPFNPETTIAYALPFNSQVRLEIYNSNGQLIESLVNKAQQAGSYQVRWNSSTVSGIYFYKLSAIPENSSFQSFTSVKKMILIK